MERILKYFCLLVVILLGLSVNAEPNYAIKPISSVSPTTETVKVEKITTTPQSVSPTVPQVVSFEQCTKKYLMPVDKLYFLALASINANKFKINEIQSKTGYILFSAANRQFLVSVNRVDSNSAIVKIVPADNNYYFPLGILTNFFKYIDLNVATQIEELG